MITLKAGIISLEGKRVVKVKRSALPAEVKALGESVAREVLNNGGAEILDEIRHKDKQEVTHP
jgi:hydroxymethylbilane synthase